MCGTIALRTMRGWIVRRTMQAVRSSCELISLESVKECDAFCSETRAWNNSTAKQTRHLWSKTNCAHEEVCETLEIDKNELIEETEMLEEVEVSVRCHAQRDMSLSTDVTYSCVE